MLSQGEGLEAAHCAREFGIAFLTALALTAILLASIGCGGSEANHETTTQLPAVGSERSDQAAGAVAVPAERPQADATEAVHDNADGHDIPAASRGEPGDLADASPSGPLPEPTPVPTRRPLEQPQVTASGDIRAIICSVPWPCAEALSVAFCESSNQPGVVSADGANFGLFQINAVHRAKVGGDLSRLLDAGTNVRVAYAIWLDQGWRPWSCKPGGN